MTRNIVDDLRASPLFNKQVTVLKHGGKASFFGLTGSAAAALLAALAVYFPSLLVLTANTAKARLLQHEISFYLGEAPELFPAPEGSEQVGKRLALLARWSQSEPMMVVAPARAVLVKTSQSFKIIKLEAGHQQRIDRLIESLIELGYKRFDIVGERGEFSVRGGIVDLWPINLDEPVRLELSDDKIESLRTFDPFSQRSKEKIKQVSIQVLPVGEKQEELFFEHLPAGTLVVMLEPLEIQNAVLRLKEESAQYLSYADLEEVINLTLSSFSQPGEEEFPELANLPLLPKPKYQPVAKEGVDENLLTDLKVGDYVVHENYGIALYCGLGSLDIDEIEQEYMILEFADESRVYVPPTMAGLVEKYSSGGDFLPKLSRLGSRKWLATRNRVKKELKDITKELLTLYAEREQVDGFAFPEDETWQAELKSTFPYEETPDQARAIKDVAEDMSESKPMDRLICGDVGYGKTEVAIRAAARAVAANKQVAVLVPTTILAEQHYNNFKERFSSSPFTIEMLSRFRSPQEQKQVVAALAEGGVDIVIGTHRLLSKDIKFKDLGLLVVDEEQRFGVAHKEKIKQFRQSVDVLTMSATPIPRTLYMSLAGVRNLSTINTSPVDRSPIRTYVLPFSELVVKEAIRRELDRGGQVYFVHNFVESIEGMAAKLMRLVPEARVAIGHGQLPEKELEKTMLDFMAKKYDILVCTSIIESGLDIPNVNTILIDQADRFGLSQLYQIRGRVGRSPSRAYAYLFYHPEKIMTGVALERLQAIQEFTSLGSGYKLAMRDLEIRGAGNLLGAQQSGHIAEVGFDLYCELLEEAVREVKGIKQPLPREVEIDLKIEAFIPDLYVTDERQRIALYRRINLLRDKHEVEELKSELGERYGVIPDKFMKLFDIVNLKLLAIDHKVKRIWEEDKYLYIEWLSGKRKKVEISGQDKLKLSALSIRK